MSAPTHPVAEIERPALDELTQTVRGAAQLLDSVAGSGSTPPRLRAGLELLSQLLSRTAERAALLAEEVGVDISGHLGVTTSDLAQMKFTPVNPSFRRQPATLEGWTGRAQAEFMLWGAVEAILTEDDVGLERRFGDSPDEHLIMIDALEKLRERWQGELKLLEATLLRMAVAVARWEQNDQH